MVLTNAEVRPRPRPVSAITPDTPLHEVAINTWMCVERMVTPRQRRWRIGRAFCQRASPSPFSLEDPADTADSYACWTGENADEAAVGWTERVRHDRPFPEQAPNASVRPGAVIRTGLLPELGRRRIRAPFPVRISCYLRQDGGTGGLVVDEAPFATLSGAVCGSGRVRFVFRDSCNAAGAIIAPGGPRWPPSLRKCVGHKAGAGSQSW